MTRHTLILLAAAALTACGGGSNMDAGDAHSNDATADGADHAMVDAPTSETGDVGTDGRDVADATDAVSDARDAADVHDVTDSGTDTGVTDTANDTSAVDTGTDTGVVDTGTDTGVVDAGTDTGTVDTGTDATVDTGTDTGATDAGQDVVQDTGSTDTGMDVSMDAVDAMNTDTGTDVAADVVTDMATDAGSDADAACTMCNGVCVDTNTDPLNCGGCGVACSLDQATPICVNGICAVGTCQTGTADCDHFPGNGCERNIGTITDCAGCNAACPQVPNAAPTCTNSTCGFTCNTGYADCNHDPSDGCEVNTLSDSANCGACTTPCGSGTLCSAGACATSCGSGTTTCTSGALAYCADTTTDMANCGGCQIPCAAPANSVAACTNSTCAVTGCFSGFGDCNNNLTDGCETNFLTDLQNCGGCGNACGGSNATWGCDGACFIASCDVGFTDCNGSASDGCESATDTDPINCGACGVICPVRPGTAATCTAGACGTSCLPGFADCDGDPSNGCEVDTNDDAGHCGACGTTCGAGECCSAGVCSSTCGINTANRYVMTPSTAMWVDACGAPGAVSVLGSVDDCTTNTIIALPFSFSIFGTIYDGFDPSADGWVQFGNVGSGETNRCSYGVNALFPDPQYPRPAIFAFNVDLYQRSAGVCYVALGTAPNRQFVVESLDSFIYYDETDHLTFEVVLNESDNSFDLLYHTLVGPGANGQSENVGVIDETGTIGTEYEHFVPGSLGGGLGVHFAPAF